MSIDHHLKNYLAARTPTARYASFDYCFNYYQTHREEGALPELLRGDALQLSCLHLGFYLASWGMLRGSSDLLQRSVRHLIPLVEVIATSSPEIWEIDANTYGDGTCPAVFDAARHVRAALPNGASDILVTKIMLGTFGCVPAFDTYFKKGFGVSTFGPTALRKVGQFYDANADVIDRNRVHTLDFASGQPTKRRYTRAKVIRSVCVARLRKVLSAVLRAASGCTIFDASGLVAQASAQALDGKVAPSERWVSESLRLGYTFTFRTLFDFNEEAKLGFDAELETAHNVLYGPPVAERIPGPPS